MDGKTAAQKLKIKIVAAKAACTLLVVIFAVLMSLGALVFLSGFSTAAALIAAAVIVAAGAVIIFALWSDRGE